MLKAPSLTSPSSDNDTLKHIFSSRLRSVPTLHFPEFSLKDLREQVLANAAFLYPKYASALSIITRVTQNSATPFDADTLHATTYSALLTATTDASRIILIEAATARCPLTGKLRVDYHIGCELGSRRGAIDALLLKTEMMIDEKMREEVEVGRKLVQAATQRPSIAAPRNEDTWIDEGGVMGIGARMTSRRRRDPNNLSLELKAH